MHPRPTTVSITEFPVSDAEAGPYGITTGPDGALWFTEFRGHRIGRITTAGEATSFALPTPDAGPFGIAAGPDDALWFTEAGADRIGMITA
ncbi:MAG TPA: virginiamycin B lyase, partial [Streptomyces sp.]|nr:virginiamycin B lyase [Streptomyces sp.]